MLGRKQPGFAANETCRKRAASSSFTTTGQPPTGPESTAFLRIGFVGRSARYVECGPHGYDTEKHPDSHHQHECVIWSGTSHHVSGKANGEGFRGYTSMLLQRGVLPRILPGTNSCIHGKYADSQWPGTRRIPGRSPTRKTKAPSIPNRDSIKWEGRRTRPQSCGCPRKRIVRAPSDRKRIIIGAMNSHRKMTEKEQTFRFFGQTHYSLFQKEDKHGAQQSEGSKQRCFAEVDK